MRGEPCARPLGGTTAVATTFAFVGCLNREAPYFQGARGKGIAVFRFDEETGAMTLLSETGGIDNPTFLSIDPARRTVYANSEVFGWNEGTTTAYRLDPATGRLTYLGKQPTEGSITAYNSLDRSGGFLLVANYAIGDLDELPGRSAVVMPIRDDGGLGPVVDRIAHSGTGPNAARQERPHAHSIVASPDNRFVIVADLGIDKLMVYRLDAESGRLSPAPTPSFALPPGAGPRHLAFHPSGKYVFVNNEMAMTETVFAYDAEKGALTEIETVSTLPEADRGKTGLSTAETLAHPNGRVVYVSNRTHDTIAVFACDPATGKLTQLQNVPVEGEIPRNICLDPTGKWLIAAHQNSGTAALFKVDQDSGKLTFTGTKVNVPGSICVRFLGLD